MTSTPELETTSTKRQRIAELARQMPGVALRTLAHYIDLAWLREAFFLTRRNGAPGIDGQTACEYEVNLDENLQRLLERAKSGTYRAPPVRRVQIPKGNGAETRPIGIPTFEDKVLQRAVLMVLEAVYEQDFRDCSHGFRPGRGAHGALDALWKALKEMSGGWVIEVDFRKFFDTLDHRHLRDFVGQRIQDGVLIRLIGKWLNAGVMAEGSLSYPEAGTPQGGVISPLLANIYLDEVIDVWFEDVVRPQLRGRGVLIRYADDLVMVFANERDAQRVMDVLPARCARFGLKLHPDKTKLLWFGDPRRPGGRQPGSFDFLGFTHHWGRTRRGGWTVKQRTASDRFTRALQRVARWCQRHMHDPLEEQHKALSRKLRGHNAYFGLTGNMAALRRFLYEVQRRWHRALARRSQRGMTWARFHRLLEVFRLPEPCVVHSVYRLGAKP